MDIALPRNTKKWFEVLPKDIDEMIDAIDNARSGLSKSDEN